MKHSFLLIIGIIVASISHATVYTTILDNGVATWSIDGSTPCGCTPDGDGVGDVVNIYHSITVPHAIFKGRLNVFNGTANFSGGLTLNNGEIFVAHNAILDAYGSLASHYSTYEIHGALKVFGSFSFYWSHLIGSGQMDIQGSCAYYQSSINGLTANSPAHCGVYSLENINSNIWNGTSWSKGNSPSSCSEYAILNASYSTSQGSITAKSLVVKPGVELTITNNTYVDICEALTNEGSIVIENMGSLVEREGAELLDNGTFVVKREGQHDAMRYNIWSSPVKDSLKIDQIFPATNACDIYVFEPHTQTWKYDYEVGHQATCNGNLITFGVNDVMPFSNGTMRQGLGYFVPGPAASASFQRTFNGTVNNGDISVTINATSTGEKPLWLGNDWNMVGNPYPCSLDATEFWKVNAKNGKITDGIYLWVENAQPPYDQFKSYLVWNPLGATYLNNGLTPFDGVIPSCSGFWVYAAGTPNSDVSYQLNFTNSMRLTNGRSLVPMVGSGKVQFSDYERKRAWIILTTDSNEYDQILVGELPLATDNVDPLFDAHYNTGSGKVILASKIGNEKFTIQSLAPREGKDTVLVNLFIHTTDTTEHYLSLDSTLYFTDQKEIYLIDSVLNDTTIMELKVPVELGIQDTGTYENRFKLMVITDAPAGTKELATLENVHIWVYNNQLHVDGLEHQKGRVEIYSIMGQKVFERNLQPHQSTIMLPNFPFSAYFVRVYDGKNGMTQKQVIIQ